MSDTADKSYRLERLGSNDARDRARMLQAIAQHPLADRELLAACEKLLEDRDVCLLTIPYSFGEVRWVAADAVAALRAALGIAEPVELRDTFSPCSTDDIAQLAKEASLPMRGGVDGVVETLKQLVAMNRVARRTITRTS